MYVLLFGPASIFPVAGFSSDVGELRFVILARFGLTTFSRVFVSEMWSRALKSHLYCFRELIFRDLSVCSVAAKA